MMRPSAEIAFSNVVYATVPGYKREGDLIFADVRMRHKGKGGNLRIYWALAPGSAAIAQYYPNLIKWLTPLFVNTDDHADWTTIGPFKITAYYINVFPLEVNFYVVFNNIDVWLEVRDEAEKRLASRWFDDVYQQFLTEPAPMVESIEADFG